MGRVKETAFAPRVNTNAVSAMFSLEPRALSSAWADLSSQGTTTCHEVRDD